MKKIDAKELNDNFFKAIGQEWMLVAAGREGDYNMMTASWGGTGWLWNRAVAFVFVRPERHTFGFIEQNDYLSLSFLGNSPEARATYQFCGSKSGKDVDKMNVDGLTPDFSEQGIVCFQQSRLTLKCRKLYADDIRPEGLSDSEIEGKWYGPGNGWHRMYIVEIEAAYVSE